jgi:steroid 5-alpha reductase family enzyme
MLRLLLSLLPLPFLLTSHAFRSQSSHHPVAGLQRTCIDQQPKNALLFTSTTRGGSTVLRASPFPTIQTIALSCLLPTSLGFYKAEYGVSYAYGTSVAVVAYAVLRAVGGWNALASSVAAWHALALVFYGVRLDLFLLLRELFVPHFRKVRDRIEERTKSKGNRLSRTPFLLSCALLYACLAGPLLVTARKDSVSKILVACTWAGFLLAAIGDLQKTVQKARRGEDALITGGIFKVLRHPNYTGEVLGWTASCLVTVVAAMTSCSRAQYVPALIASVLGWAGIIAVLARATNGLERRQKEKYGDQDEYKKWIEGSWAGITLQKKR